MTKGDGGYVIPADIAEALYDHQALPLQRFGIERKPLSPLTRRQRLRIHVLDMRASLADRIGGGRYYSRGCDCD